MRSDDQHEAFLTVPCCLEGGVRSAQCAVEWQRDSRVGRYGAMRGSPPSRTLCAKHGGGGVPWGV